ncbi:nickel-binding protein [Leptolyngbya sp. KIOST-1]|uniref:nickel-binding protein n=1 Tax=Leptolyngbya sp. KIOST-1 TaxID=1229172 RepID=UPI000565D308|nr:nickel-binding protein [Leptolyngbya sp. KIOST-1]
MSLIVVETLADAPLTPENPTETDYKILDCLGARLGTWQYSLLSSDRLRMLCVFEAPDAEAVRESYHRAGGAFDRIWSAQRMAPATPSQANGATLQVIESVYSPALTLDQWQATHDSLQAYFAGQEGVEWVKSYLSLNRIRGFCELYAPDTEVIQAGYRQAGGPFHRVWSAKVIQA